MATLKQIEAARRNGALSRGPVTSAGKARTATNALKHGIYSKAVVLHNEDQDAYALTLHQFLAEWQPASHTERRLVTDIVNADWRIDRLTTYETGALDFETDRMRPDVDATFENIDEATRATLAFNSLVSNNATYATIQTAIRTQHRLRDRALTLLLRLQRERRAADAAGEPAPATLAAETGHTEVVQAANFENRRNEPATDAGAGLPERLAS